MDLLNTGLELCCLIIIFVILTLAGSFIFEKVRNSPRRYLNPLEFLPEDEIFTLKQLSYLIILAACFINFLYSFISPTTDFIYLAIFDIALSVYIAIELDKSSIKNIILWILLVPFGSLNFLVFHNDIWYLLELVHVPIFLYFIKVYYDKFNEYTESNGLGVTILLLFLIVFISFFLTQITEQAYPIDSLVMVSNAFTSNGYAVLGSTVLGKINSIFLVWGGYIISCAGTASLTAAILMRHFNKRFEELEKLMNEGDDYND